MLLWDNFFRAMRGLRASMSGANGANGATDGPKNAKAKLDELRQRIKANAGVAKIALALAATFSWSSFTFGEKDSQQSWRLGIALAEKSAADAHVSILIEKVNGKWVPGTGWVSTAGNSAVPHAVSNLWIGSPATASAVLLAQDIPFSDDSPINTALTEVLSALNTDPEMEKALREGGMMYDKVLRDPTRTSTITGIAFAYSDLGCPQLTVMADLLGQGVSEADATFTVKRDRANLAWGDGKNLYGLKYGEYAANQSRNGQNQFRPHKINGSVSGSGEQPMQELINLASKDPNCPKTMKVISKRDVGGRSRGADLKASLWQVGSTEAAITAQDKSQAADQGVKAPESAQAEISI